MPYHLELGSDGHSFKGKAIVVNSITGRHLSHAPIPLAKAEAQKRVVEQAEPSASAPSKMGNKGTPLPPAEAKRLLAQLAERKKEARMAKMKSSEYVDWTTEKLKERKKELEKEMMRGGRLDDELYSVFKEVRDEITKREAKAGAEAKAKPKETVSAYAIEQWLERLIAIDLIEEGVVKDEKGAEKYIQEKKDEGEYTGLLEESLEGRGHREVAQNIYDYFNKKGNSPKNIKESMRELIEDGYSMFEDLV